MLSCIVVLVLALDQVIQVGEDGIVLGTQSAEAALVIDSPLCVELGHHDLDGVDVTVVEILVAAEEVFQE